MDYAYLYIAIAILLVISPLVSLLPSPRQKQKMVFRQRAIALGMQVQLASIPTARHNHAKENPLNGIAYRLPRNPQQLKELRNHTTNVAAKVSSTNNEWLWFNEKSRPGEPMASQLLQCFQEMPSDVAAIELSRTASSIYWREKGTVEDVDQILKLLKNIQSIEMQG